MNTFRGRASYTLSISVIAVALSYGCGSGDDDAATPAAGGSGAAGGSKAAGGSSGSKATGGDAGTDSAGGATDTGGSTSSGGSSGKGGSSSAAGGSGAKGGTAGSSGSSGTAGVSGNTSDLLDAIGEACKSDCDAQFASDCAPSNSNTLTCQLTCAAQTTQLGDFCLGEYRDYVACRAEGGYDCITSGSTTYPYPRSTCALEQQAFTMCTQHIGCKRYCQQVAELGCNDTPLDTCIDTCIDQDSTLTTSCSYRMETIAYCQATQNAQCDGEQLAVPASCASQVLSVAECISDDSSDLCDGWCWAADHLGCGSKDCATTCADQKAPAMCGSEWDSLLDCVLFFDEAACEGDRLVGNSICESEQTAYDNCMQGDAGAP